VQDHRLGNRIHELGNLVPSNLRRPQSNAADRLLGRAIAMMSTWASGEAIAKAAMQAHQAAPDDPRSLNLLALATLRWRGNDGGQAAFDLLRRASAVSPHYLPAIVNLTALAESSGNEPLTRTLTTERDRRLASTPDWLGIDGPTFPFGFDNRAVDRSLALQQAIRSNAPQLFAQALTS